MANCMKKAQHKFSKVSTFNANFRKLSTIFCYTYLLWACEFIGNSDYDAKHKLTFIAAFNKLINSTTSRVGKIDPTNLNQSQNDGMSAEFILCGPVSPLRITKAFLKKEWMDYHF